MNTTFKLAPWIMALVLAAMLFHQAQRRKDLETRIAGLERTQQSLRAALESRAPASAPAVRGVATTPSNQPHAAAAAAPINTMAGRVRELRDFISRLPDQSIPELSLATEGDWYAAVAGDGSLESAEEFRDALARLRGLAERRFAAKAMPALKAFMAANDGAFPKHTVDLAPHFEGAMAADILARYKVAPASEVPNVGMGGDWIITQTRVVDSGYDSRIVIGPRGFGTTGPSRRKEK